VSVLLELLEGAGGVVQEYHGQRLVRHFGDPHAEYEAAVKRAAVFDRSHRTRLTVTGKAPAQMLQGTLTGTIPGEPSVDDEGIWTGTGHYQAVLTPKGRMISDAWAFRLGPEEGVGFLLDVPVAGRTGLLEHFGKFLPPRLARVTDVSSDTASISVTGAGAAAVLSRLAFGLRVSADQLVGMAEGAWFAGEPPGESAVVVRSCDVWPMAWTVYGPAAAVAALWRALVATGVQPAGLGVWSTLRVEAGRPVYGTDMDDRTIPPEAGIVGRAIDQTKGCYTGQEVIVRIRDRGHVNRELRRLALGDVPVPSPGTPLHSVDGRNTVVGEVTSGVQSPEFDGAVVLAYVRRGVDRVSVGVTEVDVPDGFPTPPSATSVR
jgi:folate-binding protein YgfZ